MSRNCLLCGVGGQGVVLASKLLAYTALEKGLFVRTAETIGMAQRGGSVVSHVRMGEVIYSPLIPKGEADMILAFEPGEAVRNLPYLKEGGVVVVNDKAVKPVSAALGQNPYDGQQMLEYLQRTDVLLCVLKGEEICRKAGSNKVLNVALLGAAAAAGVLGMTMEEIGRELAIHVKPQFVEMNQRALALGGECVCR